MRPCYPTYGAAKPIPAKAAAQSLGRAGDYQTVIARPLAWTAPGGAIALIARAAPPPNEPVKWPSGLVHRPTREAGRGDGTASEL